MKMTVGKKWYKRITLQRSGNHLGFLQNWYKRITLEGSVIRESPWREVGITMMRHHELDRE
ncbi:hypothetical protein DY000_02038631 [Brassica cretica]|uniref:Uncharacterized protein n=1 Tax=Brassica cretica TaxID=69181 RepID=A0ABQ7BFT9_BRACR|nr:hypothetical protein DY000_02038631 [Brassica cretica]